MAEKKINFLADFPAISTQEWMDKIITDLKGADFTKKLVWRTPEGFNVMPFYRAEDLEGIQTSDSAPGKFPYVRGVKQDNIWAVCQNIDASSEKDANLKARGILNKGVNSLSIKLNKEKLSAEYIKTLLDGIDASVVELNFTICILKSVKLFKLLIDYYKSQKYDLSKLKGSVNCDPINRMLLKGKQLSFEKVSEITKSSVEASAELPLYRAVVVNAVSLNNSGAYCTQELGYALSWGTQYMTMLTDTGIDSTEAGKKIKFTFGIGENYFMEIAKFRAARMLWAKIVQAYQPSCTNASKMNIHAETSRFNMTIYDANVNMLRSQTEAMSAALGGVDSMTVTPYDVAFKKPDEFSERIARNQQLLLKEESHFDKVVDPAAGSYYLENLTSMIAEQAWKLFLDIENSGGFFAATKKSTVQKAIKDTLAKRQKDVASRKEIYLGTNQFPNFNEKAASKIDESAYLSNCGCQDESVVEVLPMLRAVEEFEQLRLETEKAAKCPKAFMLTIGSLAMRLARAQFSCNFFACAGYEVIDNLGFNSIEEGIDAAQKEGADIIVLCSSDDEYAEFAPAAYKAIGGKQLFVVAGAPACMDDLQKQGIEHFIHVKVNVLETLKSFNAKLLK